jgi:hypothetical protein
MPSTPDAASTPAKSALSYSARAGHLNLKMEPFPPAKPTNQHRTTVITLSKTTAPTKSQEIAALVAFCKSLPDNSYLAEWLNYAIPSIIQAITSDIFPDALPAHAAQHAKQIREDAKADAEQIKAQAMREAKQITAAATAATEEQRRKLNRDTESLRATARAILNN